MAYVGWLLAERDRTILLSLFPPSYPDVIAHHITLQFGVPADHPLPSHTLGFVVGYANDCAGVEALVVEIGGTILRPNGQTFHITWSIDRAAGRKPMHSNDILIKNGFTRLELSVKIPIRIIPKLFTN